jgi:putative ABC transport system permease protein
MILARVGELFLDSCRNLVRHKVRSTLTLLGVIFGVASVITMLAIGEGAQRVVLREMAGWGLRNIIVDSVRPSELDAEERSAGGRGLQQLAYGITELDVERIAAAAPDLRLTTTHKVQSKMFFRGKRLPGEAMGVEPEYFSFFRTRVEAGALWNDVQNRGRSRVAVVTPGIAAAARSTEGVIGNTIQIGGDLFTVVGVVSIAGRHADELVLIPIETARKIYGQSTIKREASQIEFTRVEVGRIVAQAPTERDVRPAAYLIERTLALSHRDPDTRVTVPMDLLESKQRTQRILNLVLIAIAAISLVVGGIGIMNIMLAIVVERIPEIGIRRALGARRRDIFLQFLAETLTLSTLGGLAGCLLGIALVPIAARATGWPGVITAWSIIVSLLVSWLVGLVFGTAPAIRASRLHPVEALRYE